MPEQSLEATDHSQEEFGTGLEAVDGQAAAPERSGVADVLDFQAAHAQREAARADIDRLATPAAGPDAENQEAAPQAQTERDTPGEVISLAERRGSKLIAPLEDQRGRDRLTEVRPEANALLSRMIQDRSFAKEIMQKKDLGTNYSDQGISEAMAAAALPYARRAMRAAGRGNRRERMDLYKQATSDAANAVGRAMDLENLRRSAYEGGRRIQVVNAAGRNVDYKPSKKPINFLSRRGLPGRFGIHLPALGRFK